MHMLIHFTVVVEVHNNSKVNEHAYQCSLNFSMNAVIRLLVSVPQYRV